MKSANASHRSRLVAGSSTTLIKRAQTSSSTTRTGLFVVIGNSVDQFGIRRSPQGALSRKHYGASSRGPGALVHA
jgi:hypothetical protein